MCDAGDDCFIDKSVGDEFVTAVVDVGIELVK